MRLVNLAMMGFCVLLGAAFLALFFYDYFLLRQIDPIALVYLIGAVLTAGVFWKRAKTAPSGAKQRKR